MPKKANRGIPTEWVLLALNQAAYVHRSDEIAYEVVKEALRRLKVRSTEQKKRLFAKTNHPARNYLNDIHLFQHLVFLFSERYETTQELTAPASITEFDLIVRYIGFIVRKSLRRNSLYGVTGICRFICRYELKDVREIHEALIDDPDGFKTDDDFRNNRKKMRDMIFERFSKYLHIANAEKGREKHFVLRDDQNNLALWLLIAKSLDSFKPWKTRCLPSNFFANNEKENQEQLGEIERLHTLTHQDCFASLTSTLRCDEPRVRLGIPQFFFNNSGALNAFPGANTLDGDRSAQSRAMLSELRILSSDLDKRLASFAETTLSIKLDGKEVAGLKLDETNHARFTISDKNAELIEVVDENGQVVLAAHLLDEEIWESSKRKSSYIVKHKHGPKIVFDFERVRDVAGVNKELCVEVAYKNARLARLWLLLRRYAVSSNSDWQNWVVSFSPAGLRNSALAIKRIKQTVFISGAVAGFILIMLSWSTHDRPLSSSQNITRPSASHSASPRASDNPPSIQASTGPVHLGNNRSPNRGLNNRTRDTKKPSRETDSASLAKFNSKLVPGIPPQSGGCRLQ